METSTTFRTATGTLWTVTGTMLTRVSSERDEPCDTYLAIPGTVGRDGQPYVAVRVDGMVTFLADGVVKTTGRIAEVLRVTSARQVA